MRIKNWKKSFFIWVMSVLAALLLVINNRDIASAETSVVTQSHYAADSITVHWTKVAGAKTYYLGIAESREDSENEAKKHGLSFDANTISYKFTGLQTGMNYYVALRCVHTDDKGDVEETVNVSILKTLPGKVTGLTQAKWYSNSSKVYVTWDAQTAASFRYVFMNKNGKKIREGAAYTNSFSWNIDNKKCYSIKVKSVGFVGGKTYESDWSETIYLFAQPMIKSYNYGTDFAITIDRGTLKIKWKRVKFANNGYNIYVSKNRDKGYTKVAHAGKKVSEKKAKTFKGKKFKKSGTYYIYVEGLMKKGGRVNSSGIGYVWEYKDGKVKQTYYHGKYN